MSKLLKELYNKEYITLLITSIHSVYPDFYQDNFINEIFDEEWEDKELKHRMHHIAITLGKFLPDKYADAISILKKVFLQMNYSFSLENMIFQDFVEIYGMDNFTTSMNALEHFTINSSSEFAIRKFIIKYPTETMLQMKKWTQSDNHHIRRLSSEGCRPRLPWAIALEEFKNNPKDIIEILQLLKYDEHKYVQKSVANNLNDISKDHPKTVKELTSQWFGETKELDSIVKHGCRTLLKQSDKEVLSLFGFNKTSHIQLTNFTLNHNIHMGDILSFTFNLNSVNVLGKLRLEFALYFLRKNSTHSRKVFKISEGMYNTKNKSFKKQYSFKNITTRTYYKGLHKIDIILNGQIFAHQEFYLV